MEMLGGLVELLFIVNMAWIVAGVPAWLVLAVVTFVGNRRSFVADRAGRASAEEGSPVAARSGRPALIISLVLLGLTVLIVGLLAVAATWGDDGSGIAAFWSACVLVIIWDVLTAVLSVLLVAVTREIFTDKRTAGRDTMAAYVVIATSHGAVLGLVLAVGLLRNLVP